MKYVLTGGHGCGKSSILLFFEMMNEFILREAASDYFYMELAKGNTSPFDNKYSEDEILSIQLRREKSIPSEINRVFLDRSVIDCLVYSKIYSAPLSENNICDAKKMRYDLAFFIEVPTTFGIAFCTKRERIESINIHNELL